MIKGVTIWVSATIWVIVTFWVIWEFRIEEMVSVEFIPEIEDQESPINTNSSYFFPKIEQKWCDYFGICDYSTCDYYESLQYLFLRLEQSMKLFDPYQESRSIFALAKR